MLFLRYFADLEYAAIGHVMRVRPGTVAATLNAARAAVKETEPHARTFYSRRGMLLMDVDRDGRWRVIRGTKAYAGLRGRGTLTGRYRFTGIDATMIGTVTRSSVRSRHP